MALDTETHRPAARTWSDLALPAALVLATAVIGYAAWATGNASILEAAAFVSGAICVWLVVRQNIWNFPLGLINVAISGYIFYEYRLYADSGLQVVYFALNLIGWYLWLYGGEQRTALNVARTSRRELLLTGAFIAGSTAFLYWLLHKAGGAVKFWDALTTSISLAAQWLQSRKKLECWHLWILADVLYVPLYITRELYLIALLYAVFLALAVMGLTSWRKAVAA
ncbi:MAG: nicotinamide mononucleotide transporter [Acidobacteria bacterium]|nr:nicotinamide mononucleotide transporter [Acidobacteriota bacterium]